MIYNEKENKQEMNLLWCDSRDFVLGKSWNDREQFLLIGHKVLNNVQIEFDRDDSIDCQ